MAFLDLTETDFRGLIKPLGVVKRIVRLQQDLLKDGTTSTSDVGHGVSTPLSPDLSTSGDSSSSVCPQTPPSSCSSSVSGEYPSDLPYDSEIPPNFRIPTMWRPQIMEVISKRSLPTPPVRSAMIRDLVVHMFSFGKRPSRSFCKAVARQLISTYPFLKDSIGSGYGSWLQRIQERIYNVEKGTKKRESATNGEEPGPSKKKGRQYPSIDEGSAVNEEVYQQHLKALDSELKRGNPRQDQLLTLMSETFINRRDFVLEEAMSARQIINKFPAFKFTEIIFQEMALIMGKDPLNSIYGGIKRKWMDKWNPAIVRFAETQIGNKKIKQVFDDEEDSDFADWEVLKGLKLLHILFTNLSKKDSNVDAFSYFIEDYDVSALPEDAAVELPPRPSPRIGRFVVLDGEPFYYVFVEQTPLLKCISLLKTVVIWLSVHYIFNLEYHKYYGEMALFLQEFLFGLQDHKQRKSAKYLSAVTGITSCLRLDDTG